MILHRAFYAEASKTTLATLLVLTLLVASQKTVFILSSAAAGDVKSAWVMKLLALDVLLDLDFSIELALFIGILVTFNRWYRDSEMAVLTACGVGITGLLKPVAKFTLVVSLIVATHVFVVRPLVFVSIQQIHQQNAERTDIGQLPPGRFLSTEDFTYYVESAATAEQRGKVFIRQQGKPGQTISASGARELTDSRDGRRVLELSQGKIFQGTPGVRDFRVSEFSAYRVYLDPGRGAGVPDHVEGISLLSLLEYPDRGRALAEFQTRISKPIVLFMLAGIALTLSYADPRQANYRSLFVAVIVFFIYLTVLQAVRDQMLSGAVSPYIGMWWVHFIVAVVLYRLLRRRSKGLPLLPAWRGRA